MDKTGYKWRGPSTDGRNSYFKAETQRTYCFDADVEREFFEDAKREKFTDSTESGQTVILFLVKRESNKYGIGCSSLVKRIEEVD